MDGKMKKTLIGLIVLGSAAAALVTSSKAIAIEPGPGQVVFYDDYQCKKEPHLVLDKGGYPDLRTFDLSDPGGQTWNNRISCFKIGEGAKLKVFEKINYGGKSKEFARTSSNPAGMWSLSKDWWDNSISSVKIY
jgi:hypothetical protein